MPRLVMFAPCDNVLVSGDHQSVSLVIVLSHLIYPGIPPGVSINPGDPVAMRWFLFSQYEQSPEDGGIAYEQRTVLRSADGSEYAEGTVAFTPESGKLFHRIILTHNAMPFLMPGIHRFMVSIRRAGEQDWTEVSDYPIQVVHGPMPS